MKKDDRLKAYETEGLKTLLKIIQALCEALPSMRLE